MASFFAVHGLLAESLRVPFVLRFLVLALRSRSGCCNRGDRVDNFLHTQGQDVGVQPHVVASSYGIDDPGLASPTGALSTDAEWMWEDILGDTLVDKDGGTVDVGAALAGKGACMLFFSAKFCPHCEDFFPILAKAYEDYEALRKTTNGSDVEVVFVSRDRNTKDFQDKIGQLQLRSLPWHAVPFSDGRRLDRLTTKYGIQYIPAVITLAGDGTDITPRRPVNMTQLVKEFASSVFPPTSSKFKELSSEFLRRQIKVQKVMQSQKAMQSQRLPTLSTVTFKAAPTDNRSIPTVKVAAVANDATSGDNDSSLPDFCADGSC